MAVYGITCQRFNLFTGSPGQIMGQILNISTDKTTDMIVIAEIGIISGCAFSIGQLPDTPLIT